jgi:hypothetical protein
MVLNIRDEMVCFGVITSLQIIAAEKITKPGYYVRKGCAYTYLWTNPARPIKKVVYVILVLQHDLP